MAKVKRPALESTVTARGTVVAVQPTQLRRPKRTTIRTVFQTFVALCAIAPVLVAETGIKPDQLPWLAGVLAVAAIVTRAMAQPQVESLLRRFFPWLAAAPLPPAGAVGAPVRRHGPSGGDAPKSVS